jgi:DNA-binding response OmpR family regulator
MKVLIVDDEPRLATSLRKGLTAEGHQVELAGDGEHGLWLAQNSNFDAIVLDIMLPKLNGFQVCSKLRESGIWTPILMLTAKDGEHDIAEALDTGADDYAGGTRSSSSRVDSAWRKRATSDASR